MMGLLLAAVPATVITNAVFGSGRGKVQQEVILVPDRWAMLLVNPAEIPGQFWVAEALDFCRGIHAHIN